MTNKDVRKIARRTGFAPHGIRRRVMRVEARTPDSYLAKLLCVFSVALIVGCNKDAPSVATTQPSPATLPATQPTPAILNIGGEPIEFSQTHLDISREQGSLHVLLYGSDAAKPPQSSFYFDMSIDGDDPSAISGQAWRLAASSDQPVDGSVGIFIAGDTIKLQPKSVTIEFAGEFPNLTVTLAGEFLRDGDDAKLVRAGGTFTVIARAK